MNNQNFLQEVIVQETKVTDLSTAVHVMWSKKCLQGVLWQKVLPSLAGGEVFVFF